MTDATFKEQCRLIYLEGKKQNLIFRVYAAQPGARPPIIPKGPENPADPKKVQPPTTEQLAAFEAALKPFEWVGETT